MTQRTQHFNLSAEPLNRPRTIKSAEGNLESGRSTNVRGRWFYAEQTNTHHTDFVHKTISTLTDSAVTGDETFSSPQMRTHPGSWPAKWSLLCIAFLMLALVFLHRVSSLSVQDYPQCGPLPPVNSRFVLAHFSSRVHSSSSGISNQPPLVKNVNLETNQCFPTRRTRTTIPTSEKTQVLPSSSALTCGMMNISVPRFVLAPSSLRVHFWSSGNPNQPPLVKKENPETNQRFLVRRTRTTVPTNDRLQVLSDSSAPTSEKMKGRSRTTNFTSQQLCPSHALQSVIPPNRTRRCQILSNQLVPVPFQSKQVSKPCFSFLFSHFLCRTLEAEKIPFFNISTFFFQYPSSPSLNLSHLILPLPTNHKSIIKIIFATKALSDQLFLTDLLYLSPAVPTACDKYSATYLLNESEQFRPTTFFFFFFV